MEESTLRTEGETKAQESRTAVAPMPERSPEKEIEAAPAGSDSRDGIKANLPAALNLNELQALTPQALEDLCRTFDVRMHPGRTRHHHIVDLVRVACGQGVPVRVEGFFDIVADNFGLLRFPALNFLPVPEDIGIPR